ncbi:hypothetical protein H5410_001876 [Solanum commersonii]|uniref:Uncharacterized protein n=1 Tax=Solanum commersonii TaxID=4109 RepID=A0A9J6B1C1_SOLCO|nr:hypothetical protein H5410_001876 [Solanum commersonii]
MRNFPCIIILYHQFNRLSMYINLIVLLTREVLTLNHDIARNIVVTMAWHLSGFITLNTLPTFAMEPVYKRINNPHLFDNFPKGLLYLEIGI